MENQHRKITGYRDLTEYEIGMINLIKSRVAELGDVVGAVKAYLINKHAELGAEGSAANRPTYRNFLDAQPERWVSIATTHFQEGSMALIRAITQPTDF